MSHQDRLNRRINKIDPTYFKRLKEYPMCDIDNSFLGFTEIYEHLSKIIPKNRIILDFGCAYAPQAAYFIHHRKYVGIDVSKCPKLDSKNSIYLEISIQNFIKGLNEGKQINNLKSDTESIKRVHSGLLVLRPDEVFAICSYVPDYDARELVKETFPDCFVFYPKKFDV